MPVGSTGSPVAVLSGGIAGAPGRPGIAGSPGRPGVAARTGPGSFGTALAQAQGHRRLALTLTLPSFARVRPDVRRQHPQARPGRLPGQTVGAASERASNRSGVLSDALSQLGKPYLFGAGDFSTNPAAFDCSSFTKWVYDRQGITLPRTAQQQYQASRAIRADETRPGDLVFFRDTYPSPDAVTHVGIVLGDGRMVSASQGGVQVESLAVPFWASRLVGFGRPAGSAPPAQLSSAVGSPPSPVQPPSGSGDTPSRPAAATAAVSAARATDLPAQPVPVGPAAPSDRPASSSRAQPPRLDDFPRPANDNGRGLHWVPTVASRPDVVDRFVAEAVRMKTRWMVFLNEDAQIGANDYLVKRLVASGIMPVMRIYTPNGAPIKGDVAALVRHYRALGVQYFQIYNEPNLRVENPDGKPNVERYVREWLQAAGQVVAAGGLPGFGALAPGGDLDDQAFFRRALELLRDQADPSVLSRTWIALHNYTFNQPIEQDRDSHGFMAYRLYDRTVREVLGWRLPLITTEGGALLGDQFDRSRLPVTEHSQAQTVADVYRYLERERDPYYFAYSNWIIANSAGGGADPSFESHAMFLPDRARPIVAALRELPQ